MHLARNMPLAYQTTARLRATCERNFTSDCYTEVNCPTRFLSMHLHHSTACPETSRCRAPEHLPRFSSARRGALRTKLPCLTGDEECFCGRAVTLSPGHAAAPEDNRGPAWERDCAESQSQRVQNDSRLRITQASWGWNVAAAGDSRAPESVRFRLRPRLRRDKFRLRPRLRRDKSRLRQRLRRDEPPSDAKDTSAQRADGRSTSHRLRNLRSFGPIRVDRLLVIGIWNFFGFWVLGFGDSGAAINLPCKPFRFPLSQPLFPQTRVL